MSANDRADFVLERIGQMPHYDPIAIKKVLMGEFEKLEAAFLKPCTWTQQDDEWSNLWETSCGNAFVLEEGTPEENDCKFCTYCGHPLAQKLVEPEPLEDE